MQTSTDVLLTLYRVDPPVGYVAIQAYLTAIRHGLQLSDVASPCSPAYQTGRRFGRTLSYGHAIVETAAGVITIVGAVVVLPPSAGAAALVGGGVASVPAVAGLEAVDIAALEVGGAMAVHGVGVLARNAGSPLPNVSYATGNSGSEGRSLEELLELRRAYEERVRALGDEARTRLAAGQSEEEVARWAHARRRALGVEYKDATPPELLELVYRRNIERYGDPLGPSIERLRARGKSWMDIIDTAASPGGEDIIPKLIEYWQNKR